MNTQGLAKVSAEVIDISVLIATGLKGIHAFFGETEKGREGKTVLVGSWTEYKKHFGGLLATSDFPLLCKRALDSGCKLRVGRVHSYGDVSDPSTVTGSKSTGTLTSGTVLNASSIGELYYTVALKHAANGQDDKVDAVIYQTDVTNTVRNEVGKVANLNNTLTAEDVVKFNASQVDVVIDDSQIGEVLIDSYSTVDNEEVFIEGGTAMDAPVETDYTGDSSVGTGIHIFDNESDFVRISIPAMANNTIDVMLEAYVIKRQDCRAILRTPIGISGATAVDYRECSGVYTGQPVNSWLASMVYGELIVTHPTTGAKVGIPAIGDVAGCMSNKDNKQREWFASAGAKRGKIKNALGIEYNLGTAARALEADNVDSHGINPVIDDKDYGLVYWGNGTLQKEDTLLKHENVADLMIFILRAVTPLAKSELFDPNDVETWKAIHRKVRPLLETIKKGRGIWGYLYQGDQDIETIEEAVVNNPNDVDAGGYVFILWVKPKVGMKYVGIKVTVTNSGVSFEEVAGQPTV